MDSIINNMVDVSIIVPAFNHAKYISQTFDSILAQRTGFKYEIVVGDDCSRDHSREIIRKYMDRHPGVFVNISRNKNIGAANNIYELLKRSKGKYIAFCEGDDYWCDDARIERDISWLNKNPEYIGICGRTIPVGENGEKLGIEDIPAEERFWIYAKDCFAIEDFSRWQMPGHLSALTLRNIVQNNNAGSSVIRKAHPVVADRTIVLMGSLRGNIKCSQNTVSCYRFRITENGTNFMSEFKKKNMRYEDYHMMCIFEKYAWKKFHKQLDLSAIKADRFIGSVLVWMNSMDGRDWEVLWKIVLENGHKIRCIYYIGNIVVKKKIMQIFGREKRIEGGRYRL